MLFPLNENDTLLTPPLTDIPGRFLRKIFVDSKNDVALILCSSIPVAMGKIFGSKIISFGLKFNSSTNILYALVHIETRRSVVSACPFSSKAITIQAAPYFLILRA